MPLNINNATFPTYTWASGASARLGLPFREKVWYGLELPFREKVWYGRPGPFRKKIFAGGGGLWSNSHGLQQPPPKQIDIIIYSSSIGPINYYISLVAIRNHSFKPN